MNVSHFFFNAEQLGRLFPYYILISNHELKVDACGTALNNIITLHPGDSFINSFKIADKEERLSTNYMSALIGRAVTLVPESDQGIYIHGQLEYLKSTDQYLFAGNAVTGSSIDGNGINLSDSAMRGRLDFYFDVLNEIPAEVVVFDTAHRYMFINPAAIRDTALRERMIGLRDEDFCWLTNRPESLAVERRKHFNEVMDSRKIKRWEEKVVNKQGEVLYKLRHMYPVLDHNEQVKFVVGYSFDITDRKRAEDLLQVSEKKYREQYDLSPALIYTHNIQGNILSVNPAITNTLGYTEREVTAKNIASLLPVFDQGKLQRLYLDKLKTDGKARGIFRAVHRNGKDIVYLFYQSYLAGADGDDPYIIGFSHDITDRINIEKELREAKITTEHAAKAKEVFLANVSHEIRTPMNGILGVNKLLSRTQLNDQQQGYNKLIAESADSLLTIVNDLLDLEKITSNNLELESRPFNISNKLSRTLQLFQLKAKQKGIELVLKNRFPDEFVVIGDESRFAQILSNLLSNALKFTKTGSITVSTALLYNANDKVLLEFGVADTGIGISEDRLPFIFDPFMRSASSLTRQQGGTGMGLAIVKSLVEMQGGHIKVNSKLNAGTEFVFSITLKKGMAYAQRFAGNDNQIDPEKLLGKKILVAEDVELNLFLVKTLLESWNCIVDVAEDGAVALQKASTNYYDLILMDIQMPEMDGITSTRQIRQLSDPLHNSVPIIALTANALKGDSKYYKDAGMNDCVTKPYSEEHLYERITEVLAKDKGRSRNHIEPQKQQIPVEQVEVPAEVVIEKEVITEQEVAIEPAANTDTPIENTPQLMDTNVKLYDLSIIDSISKGNQSFNNKMIKMFCDITAQDVNKMQDAASTNDWQAVSALAHKLKSTVGNMGVDVLKDPIRELEKQTAADPNATIGEVVTKLEQVRVQLKADYPDAF
ncbi:PAS domain S-box protein [Mucilaginibacter sp. JRF]|uniref:PAS domain-containing hybrid sensor histidine kinase/response regulator n=1 Tax=Mucilaginibacter sp. JRF TaxID=2780088 RepID=UPI00187EF578|nr:PAS domain-containing hybrid sensor histidine kinase/response regulator [Mucilaginibacter sp. JRF]MBE9586365.1 PAS domain S-box protein [Mucilaginibacter sp. JRF]